MGHNNGPNRGPNGGPHNGPGNHNQMAGRGGPGNHPAGHFQAARNTRMVGGHSVSRDGRGRVREIRTAHGTEIHHDLRGGRSLRTMHNGRVLYGDGHGHGYSQRAYYNHGGHAYYQRTYYGRDGRMYARAYRGYYWHGHPYYGYAPGYYYHPAFYAYAYNPWPAPVYYGWGWGASPWYGSYGYYFAPAPYYPTPALWIADYMIAANLQAAYAAGQAAGAAEASQGGGGGDAPPPPAWANPNATTVMTPDVKNALAEEIREQIDADRQAAAAGGSSSSAPSGGDEAPPALNPKFKTFVVSSSLDVTGDDGQECSLSPGDVILRTAEDVIEGSDTIAVQVKTSQKGDCAAGASEAVKVDDLQEMHNHFREQVDSGMQEMAKNSGQKGMPKAPDASTTAGEVPTPTPDQDVASDLSSQQQDADQAEQQVAADPGANQQ